MKCMHHIWNTTKLSRVQPLSHVQLCDPMDCSLPGLPFHYQLLELTQTHVHCISYALQPSHLLSSPSPPTFNLSQHQGLQVAKVLEFQASASVLPMNIQDQFPLGWAGWICLQSKALSWVFSNTTVQQHQLFGVQLSLWSNSHIHTWLQEKP